MEDGCVAASAQHRPNRESVEARSKTWLGRIAGCAQALNMTYGTLSYL